MRGKHVLVLAAFLSSCFQSTSKSSRLDGSSEAPHDITTDDNDDNPDIIVDDVAADQPPDIPDMIDIDGIDADIGDDHVHATSCSDIDADIIVPVDHETIQAAIDASRPGDVICVEPGTYHERIRFSGQDVHVVGIAGPLHTIIDADSSGTVATFQRPTGPSTVLEGFTLRNGKKSESAESGGVQITDASPTLVNLHIVDNVHRAGSGGGMVIDQGSSPALRNVVIAGNEVQQGFGGGLYMTSGSSATMDNVIIANNRASIGCGGGGFIESGSLAITNGIIAGNTIDQGSGGGLYIRREETTVNLANVAFVGNMVIEGRGSALHMGLDAAVRMINVTITNNESYPIEETIECYDTTNVSLLFSNIWGNPYSNIDCLPDPIGTNGNISVDPQYLDASIPSAPYEYLHISSTSPLIDAGDHSILDPDGSRSDIGPHGGPGAASWDIDGDGYPAWWQPGPYDHAAYPAMGLDCNDFDPSITPESGC